MSLLIKHLEIKSLRLEVFESDDRSATYNLKL